MAWSLKNEGAIWWFHGIELTKFVSRQMLSAKSFLPSTFGWNLMTPRPKLFPGLHEFLHGASAGHTIVDHATAGVGGLIGVPDSFNAQPG